MVEQNTGSLNINRNIQWNKKQIQSLGRCYQNAAQISGQNAICIAFSKLIGSPLSTANRLKTRSPNITWADLKNKLSMQYSIIPLDTHET